MEKKTRLKKIREKAENSGWFIILAITFFLITSLAGTFEGLNDIKNSIFSIEKNEYSIKGTILNEVRVPIEGVNVIIPDLVEDSTDSYGDFILTISKEDITNGNEIVFSETGYRLIRKKLEIKDQDLGEITLLLLKEPVTQSTPNKKDDNIKPKSSTFKNTKKSIFFIDKNIEKLFRQTLSSIIDLGNPRALEVRFQTTGQILEISEKSNENLFYFTGGVLQISLGQNICHAFKEIPIQKTEVFGNPKTVVAKYVEAEVFNEVNQHINLISQKIRECLTD